MSGSIEMEVMSASEAAFYLRIHLGPIRAWGDALADMIRFATTVEGNTVLPVANVVDRRKRPVYLVSDLDAFIEAVKADRSDAAKAVRPVTRKIAIPAAEMMYSWKVRNARIVA